MAGIEKQASRTGTLRLRRRLLLALAVTVITLLVTEVGLRVVAKLTNRARGIVYHEEFGWCMVPHARKVGPLWGGEDVTTINSDGWRDTEFDPEPPADRTRIAVIGDSFTFGVGIDHGERFTERMEESPPHPDVLNFGINSSGTDQHVRILEEAVIHYRPSIVVLVSFLGNDLKDIRFEYKASWPKPYFELNDGELRLVRPRPDLWLRFRTASYVGELVFRLLNRVGKRNVVARAWVDRDTVPLYLALVARMARTATSSGANFVVALIYPKERDAGSPTGLESAVRDGLRRLSIETLDTLDGLARRRAAGENLYLPDGHWNPAGNAVFAELLLERLRARGWLIR